MGTKIIKFFSSHIMLSALLLSAAFSMGLATFIENDFGTERAQELVYKARWFEGLFVLIALNLIAGIIDKKMYRLSELPVFLLHIAFVIMIIGAGITCYFGYEGTVHIRQGQEVSDVITKDKGLIIRKLGENSQAFIERKFSSLDKIKSSVKVNNKRFLIENVKYYANAYPTAVADKNGIPVIGFVVRHKGYKNFSYIGAGQTQNIDGFICSFTKNYARADVNFFLQNDSIFMFCNKNSMQYYEQDKNMLHIPVRKPVLLKTEGSYKINNVVLKVKEAFIKGRIRANEIKNNNSKVSAVAEFSVNYKNQHKTVQIWEHIKDLHNTVSFDSTTLHFSYANKRVRLPFGIYLDRFEVQNYPGSESPSSFSSYVLIKRKNKPDKPFHIYMNNVLKMNGFRFFQSDYDSDKKGTILSVNYDTWGTNVTYIGYFLLFSGILLYLVAKKLFKRLAKSNLTVLLLILLFTSVVKPLVAQKDDNINNSYVNKSHAEQFGKLLIQDNNNRTKPVYTFASDLVRKLSRSESLYGLSPVQTFLGMHSDPREWSNVPLIKVTNSKLLNFLKSDEEYLSYNQFVLSNGKYVLKELVKNVYAKPSAERSKFDKAVLKADERVNICYAVFSGSYLKILPDKNSKKNHWLTLFDVNKKAFQNPGFEKTNVLKQYFKALKQAKQNNDYKQADSLLLELKEYQRKNATYELPSETKIHAELIYYKYNIFKKLFPFYAAIGVLFLIALVISVITDRRLHKSIYFIFYGLLFAGFVIHTAGLIVRWYIAGHPPMSNGYESMIFISWITVLAGFIFGKKSPVTASGTSVLAGMTLMVANLSFMDPVITNLVPVLQSYWLTLHVSVITGSYAFLGLGAVLGIINQILFVFQIKEHKQYITDAIKNLTEVGKRTLILGLSFLVIGTFLGAVWANESWGRYWGWDPKETWSLITVIVYTFVTHAHIKQGAKGLFMVNVLSLYAISSVLMTYFGVNYYLSGLHSYAGGDPVPVPHFVYYISALLFFLSLTAWFGMKKVEKQEKQIN